MEDYFRTLIEKCKDGELSANDILDRVAKSNFATPTGGSISESVRRVKPSISLKSVQEKPVYRSFGTLQSASTKPTEILDTHSDYENPSIAEGLEEPEDTDSVEEVDPILETYDNIFEKRVKMRQEFWQKYKDRDLQNYIEEQLTTIFDNIRCVQNKEQLDDIKRKCRLKWFLRMKKLRDNRKLKEEEEFRENCSFQPKINDSFVKPRYMETQSRPDFASSVSRECTFIPDLTHKESKSMKSLGSFGNSMKDPLMCLENSVSPQNKKRVQEQKRGIGTRVVHTQGDYESKKQNKIYLDDDFNEFMGSLSSVETYEKESSPRMNIRDLQPLQEDVRIEKALSFTDCKKKEIESRKQSIVAKSQAFLDKHSLKLLGSTKSSKQPSDPFLFTRLAEPRAKSTKAVPKENGYKHGDWNSKTKDTGLFKNNMKRSALGSPKNNMSEKKVNLEESANREQRLNERMEEKMAQLENEKKEKHPFRPAVSEQSELIDRKASEKFMLRESRLNERKEKKMNQLDKENQVRHPFKPQLSKTAQSMDRQMYEDKVANFIKNREEKLAKLREERAMKEMEGVTLQPKINKAVPANSKLGINLATKDYINYIREKEEVDRQFIELARRRKEAIEAIECTHTPQIFVKSSSSKNELSSPKISMHSSRSSNYKDLHQKKKQPASSSTNKLTTWNFLQKEEIYIPSLFDEGYSHEVGFDHHEDSHQKIFFQ